MGARAVVPSDEASTVSSLLCLKESAKKLPVHCVERYFPRMKASAITIFVLKGVRGSLHSEFLSWHATLSPDWLI
jgi:hypothetical protein